MKTNIAVLVSGGGTNLQALIDAQQRGELGGGEITAVIAPPPSSPRCCASIRACRFVPPPDTRTAMLVFITGSPFPDLR